MVNRAALLIVVLSVIFVVLGTFLLHLQLPADTALTDLLCASDSLPLLLWLMFRALPHSGRLTGEERKKQRRFRPHFTWLLIILFAVSLWLALNVGKSAFDQWSVLDFNHPFAPEILNLRYPRILIALCTGILLSVAGVLLQRLTLNPMASPELLGVSSGTSMGILLLLFVFSAQQPLWFWLAGIGGALVALLILSAINRHNGMLPEKSVADRYQFVRTVQHLTTDCDCQRRSASQSTDRVDFWLDAKHHAGTCRAVYGVEPYSAGGQFIVQPLAGIVEPASANGAGFRLELKTCAPAADFIQRRADRTCHADDRSVKFYRVVSAASDLFLRRAQSQGATADFRFVRRHDYVAGGLVRAANFVSVRNSGWLSRHPTRRHLFLVHTAENLNVV